MQIWAAQGEAYSLMTEYDTLPHYYGETVLYQAEAYIINHIGRMPDICGHGRSLQHFQLASAG